MTNAQAANEKITVLHEGKYLRTVCRGTWEFVERRNISGIVLILAVTPAEEAVLVEQYRPPMGNNVIELCAGLAGDVQGAEDESLLAAAQRELEEECGYRASCWEHVMTGPPAQGLCDEVLTFYLAWDLTRVGPGGGDETEELIVHHVPLAELDDWLKEQAQRGKFVDPKIYTALYFWYHRQASWSRQQTGK
ncbi:MAG: NUDIX hydrolase [Lentisphaerae bacterium]|nr:MAG: NUDIX hydrolase [Lentisphaerota bacterium]